METDRYDIIYSQKEAVTAPGRLEWLNGALARFPYCVRRTRGFRHGPYADTYTLGVYATRKGAERGLEKDRKKRAAENPEEERAVSETFVIRVSHLEMPEEDRRELHNAIRMLTQDVNH